MSIQKEGWATEDYRAFLKQLEKEDCKYKDIFYALHETGMKLRRSIGIEKREGRIRK